MYPQVKRAVTLGRAGELIAESVFEQNFYKTCRVNHEGFDLLIFDDEGESYRVEVKTSSTSCGKAGHRYKFMTSKGSGSKYMYTEKDTDLMVFVALDIRRIVVKCVTNVIRKRTTLRADEFYECEATQIRQAIEEVRKRKC